MKCRKQLILTGYRIQFVDLREPKPRTPQEDIHVADRQWLDAMGLTGQNVAEAIKSQYEHPDGDPETKCWGSWYNTRDVMGRFLYKNQRNYSIFMNMIRAFDDTVGGLPKCNDEKQK